VSLVRAVAGVLQSLPGSAAAYNGGRAVGQPAALRATRRGAAPGRLETSGGARSRHT
jgi:hypothetical protein